MAYCLDLRLGQKGPSEVACHCLLNSTSITQWRYIWLRHLRLECRYYAHQEAQEQYYDDANSGHDGYYIFNPNRGQPGEPRFLKVPRANATMCSGWDGDCDAQSALEKKTQSRARVELGGVSCAWVGVIIYLVVWVSACVVVHRFRKAKNRSIGERMAMNAAFRVIEKQENQQTYRYT